MQPSLDYIYEYPVESVETQTDGYCIHFHNGITVKIVAEGATPQLENLSLITVVKSGTSTRLVFGRNQLGQVVDQQEVEIAIGSYTISDPRFGGDDFNPVTDVGDIDVASTVRSQFNDRFADSGEPQEVVGEDETPPSES